METIVALEIGVGTVIGGILFYSYVRRGKDKLKRNILRQFD